MAAGLHREPTYLSKKISLFEQEMRRRLWFTIVEIDVQASLDRGMSTSINPYDWDCLSPLNIHDEDFDQDAEQMPPSRPMTEFTRTSFLCLAQQHLPLRLEMVARINSIRSNIELDMAMNYDRQLREILDNLPEWTDNASQTLAKPLLELLLNEYLVLLHQPFTAQPGDKARHFYSRVARRNSALTVLKTYADMEARVALTVSNLRDDLFRACLALCHDTLVSAGSKEHFMNDGRTAVELLEKAVDLMENRIRLLGQGFHAFWLSGSALALARSKMSPLLPPDGFAQQTADRVARLHGYMMKEQVLHPRGPTMATDDPLMSTANTLVGTSGNPTPNQPMPGLDPFAQSAQFNAFADTLFDFDITDIWNTDAMIGLPLY
jgi:hypothetical protein